MLQCPLSRSKLQELCDHLLHRTSDIYTRGRNNMTPLHLAVLVSEGLIGSTGEKGVN